MKYRQINVGSILPIIRSASKIQYPVSIEAFDELQADLRSLIDLIEYDRVTDMGGGYDDKHTDSTER